VCTLQELRSAVLVDRRNDRIISGRIILTGRASRPYAAGGNHPVGLWLTASYDSAVNDSVEELQLSSASWERRHSCRRRGTVMHGRRTRVCGEGTAVALGGAVRPPPLLASQTTSRLTPRLAMSTGWVAACWRKASAHKCARYKNCAALSWWTEETTESFPAESCQLAGHGR